jgi:hypothetical protein
LINNNIGLLTHFIGLLTYYWSQRNLHQGGFTNYSLGQIPVSVHLIYVSFFEQNAISFQDNIFLEQNLVRLDLIKFV